MTRTWRCDDCGAINHEDDSECQFCDAPLCLGHETTSGPIGSTIYCDGSCRR